MAKDISGILGYRDAANLVRRLDEDEKDTQKTSTPSGKQEMTARLDEDEISKRQSTDSVGRRTEIIIINESGLYNAVLGSTKPNAREFRKWVTGEVLPSIRKTGGYLIAGKDESPEEIMARASP